MSQDKKHVWLTDLLKSGRFSDAKKYMEEHKINFKDLCAPTLKHCVTNPIYAIIKGMAGTASEIRAEGRELIKTVVAAVPEMLDIVTDRVNALSYLITNMDEPELVQLFISTRPYLMNDRSDYTNPKNQTSEYSSTFTLYKNYTFNSPVHLAVMGNKLKSLDVLIKNGANVNLKNITPVTPLDQYFINCHKLDMSIPTKLAKAGGDITSLSFGINNKCWDGLNKVLPTSKAAMTVFQFNTLINKTTLPNGDINKEAITTAYLSLPHLAKDFDVKKYGAVNCNQEAITQLLQCQKNAGLNCTQQAAFNTASCKKMIDAVMDMQHANVLHASATDHHSEL